MQYRKPLSQNLSELIQDIEKKHYLYRKPIEAIKPILLAIADDSDKLKNDLLAVCQRVTELENDLGGCNDVTDKNKQKQN